MSSMKNLNISLVIPAHNEEKYIGACLDHATKNSRGGFFEVIVIDNASTDRTGMIAEAYPGVRVVREEQKGLTHARQRGFTEAKGDVIAFIDADTRMPKDWYRALVAEFSRHETLACLSGPYVYHDIPRWQRALVKTFWYTLAMPAYLAVGYMAIGGNFAIRRSVLQKMKGFDTSIAFYGEDTDIARRARAFGKVKFKPSFFMYTSGRRFAGQGFLNTALIYVANFFSEAFAHKPTTQKYRDIR